MIRKATKLEAEKLIRTFGEQARQKAQEAVRDARRRRNGRQAKFFMNVARRIEMQIATETRRCSPDGLETVC